MNECYKNLVSDSAKGLVLENICIEVQEFRTGKNKRKAFHGCLTKLKHVNLIHKTSGQIKIK